MYATTPKGIVGGFELTYRFSKKFERMGGEALDICLRLLKESSNSMYNVLSIPHITLQDCRLHIFPTFLEIAVYMA